MGEQIGVLFCQKRGERKIGEGNIFDKILNQILHQSYFIFSGQIGTIHMSPQSPTNKS